MTGKLFTSAQSWFNLTLPDDWSEYEDEEGTYAFFNEKNWTGNFRVTPFRWEQTTNDGDDKAAKYISGELEDNKDAVEIKLGIFPCAHYKKNLAQEGDEFIIYYWITGLKNNLFICSFTINKEQESTEKNTHELNIVETIIKSITLK